MVPRRQARGVHGKARLAGQRTADNFTGREHSGVLSPEANGLTKLDEAFGL